MEGNEKAVAGISGSSFGVRWGALGDAISFSLGATITILFFK